MWYKNKKTHTFYFVVEPELVCIDEKGFRIGDTDLRCDGTE